MTDKQTFLKKLKLALTVRGVSDIDAAPFLSRFEVFYDRMVKDPERSEIIQDIDRVAENIAAQIQESYDGLSLFAAPSSHEESLGEDLLDDATAEISIPSKDLSYEAATDMDIPAAEELFDAPTAVGIPLIAEEQYEQADEDGFPEKFIPAEGDFSSDSYDDRYDGEYDESYIEDGLPSEDKLYNNELSEATSSTRLPDYVEEEPIPNSKLFWILFAVCSPLWIPLILAVLLVFGAMWTGLAGVLAAAIIGMVAVIAVGSIAALIGIIYGITRLFVSLPVGLYEIGLGVMFAGAAMLFGIVLYNFALRFIPFVMRKVLVLFKFTFRKIKMLFNYLRRECAKQ